MRIKNHRRIEISLSEIVHLSLVSFFTHLVPLHVLYYRHVSGLDIHSSEERTNIFNIIIFIKLRFFDAFAPSAARDLPACFTTKMEAWLDPIQLGLEYPPSNATLPACKFVLFVFRRSCRIFKMSREFDFHCFAARN